jgi:putative FmdB family regulatory protein
MPTYDFVCKQCGVFELVLKISDRNSHQFCPDCGAASERILLQAPQLKGMEPNRRIAFETNERASHEPTIKQHKSGCSCCSKPSTSVTPKSFANKRPWMISH